MGTTRTSLYVLTLSLALSAATPTRLLAGPPAAPGVLPPEARPHGHTLTDLATGWLAWAFGTPASVNSLIANRCEQSPLDPKVWFLPVSLGGEALSTCYVPAGTVVVLIIFGNECSEAEGFGSTVEELTACAESVSVATASS